MVFPLVSMAYPFCVCDLTPDSVQRYSVCSVVCSALAECSQFVLAAGEERTGALIRSRFVKSIFVEGVCVQIYTPNRTGDQTVSGPPRGDAIGIPVYLRYTHRNILKYLNTEYNSYSDKGHHRLVGSNLAASARL